MNRPSFCANVRLAPLPCTVTTTDALGAVPLKQAANADSVKPDIGTGLSSPSRSSTEVIASCSTARLAGGFPDGAVYPWRKCRTRPGRLTFTSSLRNLPSRRSLAG